MSEFTTISSPIFEELYALGLHPIPIIWDIETNSVLEGGHPKHKDLPGKPSIVDYDRWKLLPQFYNKINGIALKLYAPLGMIDFDLKNTDDKSIYDTWFKSVEAISPDTFRKVVIETTKSGGYHVYFKYPKLSKGKKLAVQPKTETAKGGEIIALYTDEKLSYCCPSPGYNIFHNNFEDLADLTDDEFDIFISIASNFDKRTYNDSLPVLIDYPPEYENTCIQFDKCDKKVFEGILNSIDLFWEKIKKGKFGHYDLYKRKGSLSEYSAKVFFSSNRCLIFSGSMIQFPSWHDRTDDNDKSWVLTPSKILYYKNNGDWAKTMEDINAICESAGIVITHPEPVSLSNPADFPVNIFPKKIIDFINSQQLNIQEYLSGSVLVALSTIIGNDCALKTKNRTYYPCIYMVLVAIPGAGKTPALRLAFAPLEAHDTEKYLEYSIARDEHNKEMAKYKKEHNEMEPPPPLDPMKQLLIKDATIEMVGTILSFNPTGCSVLVDELSGFLTRMNRYSDKGGDPQKWLEIWSAEPVLDQRIGRNSIKVSNPFCNIIGGIQTDVLPELAAEGRNKNGFYHRFLFIYPDTMPCPDWNSIHDTPNEIGAYKEFVNKLLDKIRTRGKWIYNLSTEAEQMFNEWYNGMNRKWAATRNENSQSIIAKYKDYYCLRLALLIQVLNDPDVKMMSMKNMEKAICLTEYFLTQIKKAVKTLNPDSPADKLDKEKKDWYESLPENFILKTALKYAENDISIQKKVRNWLAYYSEKSQNRLFERDQNGNFRKLYW